MSRRHAASAAPRLARPRIVGDVVDGAAERIDFEHRLALRRAAESACRCRTSCRRRAARRLRRCRSLTHPAACARRRTAAGRAAATRRAKRRPAVPPATATRRRDARSRSADRAAAGSASADAPSVLMTETSRPSRQSSIAAAKPSLSPSSVSVRAASWCRHSSSAGDARSAPSASTVTPLAAKRVQRNVDAVEIAIVLAAVLQMIDDLQRRAQRIVGRPDRAALAMHVADEAADRHRRECAIADQIVPVAVAQLGDVEPECGEQILRVLRRQVALGERGAQPHRNRIARRCRR